MRRRSKLTTSITPVVKSAQGLAVITCHFNWGGYTAPRANLMRFLRHMKSFNVDVYGVEAYQHPATPFTKGVAGWKQIAAGENNLMWQKETLLNIAESLVPDHIEKIAWIDADLWFENMKWVECTSHALDHFPIVQPFEQCVWTKQDGTSSGVKSSCFKVGLERHWRGHPGFAMAARRDLWRSCNGLYQYAVCGAGDTVFACAAMHKEAAGHLLALRNFDGIGLQKASTREYYDNWASRLHEWCDGKHSYVSGRIWHDWHGDLNNRRYQERSSWMTSFDISEVRVGANGLLEWSDSADRDRVEQIKNYFSLRQEDATAQVAHSLSDPASISA